LAEKFVDDFFIQFNNGNFETIYDDFTDGRLKIGQEKKEFIRLLETVQKKIGKYVRRSKEGVKLDFLPMGKFFTISYTTSHQQGSAIENFTLRKNEDNWLLAEYSITSKELILK